MALELSKVVSIRSSIAARIVGWPFSPACAAPFQGRVLTPTPDRPAGSNCRWAVAFVDRARD
ncbi:hypothetical protein JW859_08800 [bacterium]|nr:hypothetical protein [bacterium]